MTSLRYDPELRVFNFAKLVTFAILLTLIGVLLAFGIQRVKPTLNESGIETTAGAAVTLSGTGLSGESIEIYADDLLLADTRIDASGNWEQTVEAPQAAGTYSIRLNQGGLNLQQTSNLGALTVVASAEAMAEAEAMGEAAVEGGDMVSAETTDKVVFKVSPDPSADASAFADGIETMSGTAPPEAKVLLILDDVAVASVRADAEGNWEQELSLAAPGAYDFRVAIADNDDVVIATTEAVRVVRYIAPSLTFDQDETLAEGEIALSGVAEPNALIGVAAYGELVGSVDADEAGNWRWAGSLPADEEYVLQAVMLDANGETLVFGESMTLTLPSMAEAVADEAMDAEDVMVEDAVAAEEAEEAVVEEAMVESEASTDAEASAEETVAEPAVAEPVVVEVEEEIETIVPQVAVEALKLPDALASDGRFNTLYAALDLTGNVYTLKLDDPFTIFAPTDAAFGKLPARVLTGLQNNPNALRAVLLHHLIPGEVLAGNLPVGGTVFAAGGTELEVGRVSGGLTIGGVPISAENIIVKNGVIHELEGVMLPPSEFAATQIDASGVAEFAGSALTVTGSAEPGATILVELNGEPYGSATADWDGTWAVASTIQPGEYDIVAYALDRTDVLQNVSSMVRLIVTE